ncbi:MAG TPA: alkaline phosphatase PhoX [Thermodesulfobacteriota bacterium]
MPLSRRGFLAGGTALAALAALGSRQAFAVGRDGYGPLVADPDGILDLPEGFRYRVLSRLGDPMSDGSATPAHPDGMAAFPNADGTITLVRNHEMNVSASRGGGVSVPAAKRYDPGRGAHVQGGTTSLVVSPDGRRLLGAYPTLGGTLLNCAGGPTPWRTWISCEETVATAASDDRLTKRHGYAFEVPASARAPVTPVPLKAMGRFRREAVAVDPRSGRVYQTEDEPDACLYRFTPATPGRLADGGSLHAMRLVEFRGGVDTSNRLGGASAAFPLRYPFEVEWVPIPTPDPSTTGTPVRHQAQELGAAVLRRAEGIWWSPTDRAFYICSTDGGAGRSGQIFRLTPQDGEPDLFELYLEAPAPDTERGDGEWEWPDNITAAPWGGLVVCQDGPGRQHLSVVTAAGEVFRFARNALDRSEFAGACFSPDGTVLFVNVFGTTSTPGLTLAVTGPW